MATTELDEIKAGLLHRIEEVDDLGMMERIAESVDRLTIPETYLLSEGERDAVRKGRCQAENGLLLDAEDVYGRAMNRLREQEHGR